MINILTLAYLMLQLSKHFNLSFLNRESEDFARDLEEAILLAGCGKWKRLRETLEDPDQAEEVLEICKLLDEEKGKTRNPRLAPSWRTNPRDLNGYFKMLKLETRIH